MRPDEHKKRKNAQYKKKHGLTAQGNKSEGTTTDEGNKKLQKSSKKKELSHVKSSDQKAATSAIAATSAAGGVGGDDDDYDRQFSKGKLVSNWSRYDDMPSDDEDELPCHRGEDFNKLLAEAGGAAAQFRFKDEEDWSEESREITPAVLSLDFNSIAESLNCVPLHERLGISADLLSQEQLDAVIAAAAQSRAKYDQKYPPSQALVNNLKDKNKDKNTTNKISNCPKVSQDEARNNNAVHKVDDNVLEGTVGSDSKAVSKDHGVSAMLKNATSGTSDSVTIDRMEQKPDGVQVNKDKTGEREAKVPDAIKSEIASLEDDLDMLLGLDGDDRNDCSEVQDVKVVAKKEPVKVDVVLPSCVSVQDRESKGKKSDENLEDWLDSMLDD